jgi:uncharacterized protein VcgC/VcgE DUF2780
MKRSTLALAVGLAIVVSAVAIRAQTTGAEGTANPQLVGDLAKQLNATPKQAEGAAGALFGLAKSRLKADDWTKVAGAVPGMDGLLAAAPAMDAASALPGGKSAAGLGAVAGAFTKLGLSPSLASKAVPVLTQFVSKSGGADVGKLLAGALK